MQDNQKIESLMQQAMSKINDMVDVNTVVGKPLNCPDGTLIIPITKVCIGFVAGGGEYTQNIPPKNAQKEYPFVGGSTAGVSIVPVGFLVGTGERLKLLTVENKNSLKSHKKYKVEGL